MEDAAVKKTTFHITSARDDISSVIRHTATLNTIHFARYYERDRAIFTSRYLRERQLLFHTATSYAARFLEFHGAAERRC